MSEAVRVLVLEDEPIIALDIAAELAEHGFEIVGPVARADEALDLVAREAPSVAVLDINLASGNSLDVARALGARSIPYVFLTGDTGTLNDEFGGRPVLMKPIDYRALRQAVQAALS